MFDVMIKVDPEFTLIVAPELIIALPLIVNVLDPVIVNELPVYRVILLTVPSAVILHPAPVSRKSFVPSVLSGAPLGPDPAKITWYPGDASHKINWEYPLNMDKTVKINIRNILFMWHCNSGTNLVNIL